MHKFERSFLEDYIQKVMRLMATGIENEGTFDQQEALVASDIIDFFIGIGAIDKNLIKED